MNNIFIPRKEIIIPKGAVMITLRNVITGRITHELYKNMFVTAGKNSLADHIRGTTADNKGIITYCALGTGLTAPALADTILQTEIARKLVSVRTVAANVALFETFFTTAEAIGSLKEAGLFGDNATSSVDTGTLFCRVAINRTKSANDTLTLQWSLTIA